jgi:AICAR transformylase/IMP cyclohydrolase PurH
MPRMTTELPLKYGCNPNQPDARILFTGPGNSPLAVVNGNPSFINALDGLRGWELVRDLKAATNKPAAASFKHVSPAGAAVAGELNDDFCKANFYPLPSEHDYSLIASAYAKARSSDRGASFGDFIAVSETVDASLAALIKPEVSDGIIAPGYDDDAKAILAAKKGGNYVMLQIDAEYAPASGSVESRTCFGLTLEQTYNDAKIDASLLNNITTDEKEMPDSAVESLLVATATLKHTQSNSIAVAMHGQAIGVGAGQQSRIACTRLACDKADRFMLKQHPKSLALIDLFKDGVKRPDKVNAVDQFVRYHELDDIERGGLHNLLRGKPQAITADEARQWCATFGNGQLALSSDAFIPFRDNLDRAARSGVKYVVHAGGSARDDLVTDAANEHGMVMALSGLRLFLH